MNAQGRAFLRKILKDQRGQMLPMVAVSLVALLGCTGLVIDMGRAYLAYRQLQSATDAAALAGAQALPNNTAATTAANSYGAASGSPNAVPNLTGDREQNRISAV